MPLPGEPGGVGPESDSVAVAFFDRVGSVLARRLHRFRPSLTDMRREPAAPHGALATPPPHPPEGSSLARGTAPALERDGNLLPLTAEGA